MLEVLVMQLAHLSAARRALPDAAWKVTLGGRDVAWDAAEGFRLPATG